MHGAREVHVARVEAVGHLRVVVDVAAEVVVQPDPEGTLGQAANDPPQPVLEVRPRVLDVGGPAGQPGDDEFVLAGTVRRGVLEAEGPDLDSHASDRGRGGRASADGEGLAFRPAAGQHPIVNSFENAAGASAERRHDVPACGARQPSAGERPPQPAPMPGSS